MKRQVLFVHSAGIQRPDEGSGPLVTYLGEELGSEYDIRFPMMPDADEPHYTDWRKELKNELSSFNKKVILIGHSLGGSVLLKYLSEEPVDKQITGLFLVAVPYWGMPGWDVEEFMLRKDFNAIATVTGKFFFYYSDADEVVPVEHGDRYAKILSGAIVRILSGYTHEFREGLPELVKDVRSLEKIKHM